MSKLKTNTIRHVDGSNDNITLDSSQNVTVEADLTIPDKIIHSGDTNTTIRFPAADTITAETGGSERVRIDSSGRLRVGNTTASADGAFDDLIVGNHSGNVGISILGENGQQNALGFAKSGALADGYVAYNHNSTATSSSMVLKSSGKIQLDAGGSTRLQIDSGGNVTKPNNPAFRANGTNSWVALSNNSSLVLPFDNELFDNGSNYDTSTYRFTAPVAGKYYISVSLYWKASVAATSNYLTLEFRKNGSPSSTGIDYGIYGTANDSTGSQYLTTDSIQECSANDYIDLLIYARGGSIDYYMGHSQLTGFLIG